MTADHDDVNPAAMPPGWAEGTREITGFGPVPHPDRVGQPGRAGAAAWRLRLRRWRLPAGYLAFVLAAVAALIAAPYGEELWRCARAGRP